MPQFDHVCFSPQIVFVVVYFFSLYFFIVRILLPNTFFILSFRNKILFYCKNTFDLVKFKSLYKKTSV